ncbi:MAG TPA: C4-type zinc ribbon domain-containing protein [Actinomycetota bacterium]|nr:C4-type zinc ribbon domain-containing protein [Actinomycetota bacterium]
MPTDVDAAALDRLLELQGEDSAIKRLRERRASLPEAARLADVNAALAELDADLGIARAQRDDAARDQSRLEGEVDLLEQKIGREEGRLFAGSVSNPKELGALQAEVEMLKRRKSGLEDDLLEVMERREQAVATVERLEAERATTSAEAESLTATVGQLTAEIDEELRLHAGARDRIAATLPESLLTLYDRLREQKGGVGAAELVGGMCEGCHTRLPAREVERLRAQRGLQRCDNCRRILVVT